MVALKRFENLNTSFVNLAALLRYLREQSFAGSIHLAANQYEAEIFLNGATAPVVFELDQAGVPTEVAGAIERVLVHGREPGGIVTVYEGKTVPAPLIEAKAEPSLTDQIPLSEPESIEQTDWQALLNMSGDVVAAVERAVNSVGADFASHFRSASIAVGDDYPFMDPTIGEFRYEKGVVRLTRRPTPNAFVSGVSDCLRRIINKLAIDKDGQRLRERVAVELAVAARMRPNALGEFKAQLDRIAGTRVL
jgi:hypothetical protein